jgi:F-type H+-transporting ATPase subunit epsilon
MTNNIMPIHVDVITPEKLAFSDEVDFIAAPAAEGEIGILPRHAPLLVKLGPGHLRLKKGNDVRHLALSGGFLEVQQGSRVEVFAETAEMADEIDQERARQAADRVKAELKKPNLSDVDLIELEAALTRATTRIHVAQYRRSKPGSSPQR